MCSGDVIILNGVSSSGKTTLARNVQTHAKSVFLHCPLDAFWNMAPRDIGAGSENFPRMKEAIAHTVRALADTGHNVIVDIILAGNTACADFLKPLKGLTVLLIKVDCDQATLENRELRRQDRRIGLAASQLETTHVGVKYDLTVNTSNLSQKDCAASVLRALKLSKDGKVAGPQAASASSTNSG